MSLLPDMTLPPTYWTKASTGEAPPAVAEEPAAASTVPATPSTATAPAAADKPFLNTTTGMLTAILGPALAGGLLSGVLAKRTPPRPGEDPEERRRRILRNALTGSLLGGGIGGVGLMALQSGETAIDDTHGKDQAPATVGETLGKIPGDLKQVSDSLTPTSKAVGISAALGRLIGIGAAPQVFGPKDMKDEINNAMTGLQDAQTAAAKAHGDALNARYQAGVNPTPLGARDAIVDAAGNRVAGKQLKNLGGNLIVVPDDMFIDRTKLKAVDPNKYPNLFHAPAANQTGHLNPKAMSQLQAANPFVYPDRLTPHLRNITAGGGTKGRLLRGIGPSLKTGLHSGLAALAVEAISKFVREAKEPTTAEGDGI